MLKKFYRAIIVALLIWLAATVSTVLYPAFFLLWSVYNRKNISLYFSAPLVLLSTAIYCQLYIFFRSLVPLADIMHNPAVYYGICLIAPFLLTRLSSLRSPLATKQKYIVSVLLFVLLLSSSLVLVITVHYLSFKRGVPNYLFITEAIILLWVSIVIFLFIRNPEDALIKEIHQYGKLLFQWVQGKKSERDI